MLERFSAAARAAVGRAQDEAQDLEHRYVGTEHLLLGLLGDAHDAVAQALTAAGVTLDAARHKVAEAVGKSRTQAPAGERPLSVRATRALERASRLSLQRRDPEVGTDHILLSVLDVEGTAGQVLRGLGVDLGGLREAVDGAPSVTRSVPATEANPLPGTKAPCCPVCGVALDGALGHRTLPADGLDGRHGRSFVVAFCEACGAALGASPA